MKHNFLPYTNNKIFIETGSYGGDGIMAAAAAGFKKIYSIELSEYYFNLVSERIEDRKLLDRVELLCGDTVDILPMILEDINEPCTFWLDAHWCDPNTAIGKFPVPLIQELKIIDSHLIKTHTILIDDCRLIRDKVSEWKKDFSFTLSELEHIILDINPDYKISYIDGYVKNDILVAQI